MTLGEFLKITKDMPDDSELIVNFCLHDTMIVYSVDTDPDNKDVIIMIDWEE